MGKSIILCFAILVALLSVTAKAAEESTIGMAAYQAMYESQGPSQALPKVVVYSARGECVGITTTDQTPAPKLEGFISASLHANRRQCGLVYSEEFGVESVGPNSGTGKPVVQLVTLKEDFCSGCSAYRDVLHASSKYGVGLVIVNVDLSLAHNPGRPVAKDCPTCGKKP